MTYTLDVNDESSSTSIFTNSVRNCSTLIGPGCGIPPDWLYVELVCVCMKPETVSKSGDSLLFVEGVTARCGVFGYIRT